MGADVLAWLGGVVVAVWEWARAAFAWSDALTGGLALAAGIAAWVAISQNRKARTIAREAKEAAERGNVVAEGAKVAAEEANVIARGANRLSGKANELAEAANGLAERALTAGEGANGIARAANTLAREANDLFKRQDERETERHDVCWEGGFVEPGVYRLTNRGVDTAHHVVVEVEFEGEKFRMEEEAVAGGEYVSFSMPSAKSCFRAAQRDIAQAEGNLAVAEKRDADPWLSNLEGSRVTQMRGELAVALGQRWSLNLRVEWETQLGAPKGDKQAGVISFGGLGGQL